MSEKKIIFQKIEDLKTAYEEVKLAAKDGFQFSDLRVYIGAIAIAIEHAGIFFAKEGAEKKSLLLRILNEAIDIKWIPDFIEKIVLGFLIDYVVRLFNKTNWDIDCLKQ